MTLRLLDLFCGAGGCSVGYARAGFDVVGVDLSPHPDYPFPFAQQDAMEVLADPEWLDGFDVIHASPPCPRYSTITPADRRDQHPDLLAPVLAALRAWRDDRPDRAWIVENVPGAPLPDAVTLCGPAMGYGEIRRHRLFGASVFLMAPPCACGPRPPVGVYGNQQTRSYARPNGMSRGHKATSVEQARQVLGAPWVSTWDDLTDLIPPGYAQHVGEQVAHALTMAGAS